MFFLWYNYIKLHYYIVKYENMIKKLEKNESFFKGVSGINYIFNYIS